MLYLFKSAVALTGLHDALVPEPYRGRNKTIIGGFVRKRTFDVVFSAMIVVFLLSWLIPLIALIIKSESKGPIFFKQLRTGKDGTPFHCLKFRSMTINDDADVRQACKGDCRVTKVGHFLRKTSLDELPQFINVLKGEMSVVGPRPHMLLHTQEYSQVIDNFMERHTIMPGITGLAQVCGHRGEIKALENMAQRVNVDLHYIHHWSFMLDLEIVVLTVWKLIQNDRKAY